MPFPDMTPPQQYASPQAKEDGETWRRWQEVAARIPADVLAEITQLHRELRYTCAAEAEGLWCCMDYLTGKSGAPPAGGYGHPDDGS